MFRLISRLLLITSLSFCQLTFAEDEMSERDPWEGFNRKVFVFNETMDKYLLKPVAKGYQWVTPDPVEDGVSNFFSNLGEITTIANDLMQLKFAKAANDTGRFLVNSTVGLLGVFDVATPMGLKKQPEDFGQTLAYWGADSGPYLVVPLFGSYTVRDGIGLAVDNLAFDYVNNLDHVRTRNQLFGLRLIDTRASFLDAEDLITGDRYTFIRDAYLQRRDYLINDGVVEDSFGDEDFDDWDE